MQLRFIVALAALAFIPAFSDLQSAVAGERPGRLPELVHLHREARGEEAIQALGDKLAAVATAHGVKEEHLRNRLRKDRNLWVHPSGRLFYRCEGLIAQGDHVAPAPAMEPAGPQSAPVPISNPPIYHSRRGAPNIIYLDFNGGLVSDTYWGGPFDCYAFDSDGDPNTFSDAEQLTIKRTWQRIAEDYAPFNVDVTTEEPASGKVGVIMFTQVVCKGGNQIPANGPGVAGIAFIGVFGNAAASPAWVNTDTCRKDEDLMSEVGSHEMGHNMGLHHDGSASVGQYYWGHGSGDISWNAIMGGGVPMNVSQWSKGEYYGATNTEDDLSIIASNLSYRTDDCGNTNATAKSLTVVGTTISSTTPENDPDNANPANKGMIETNTDVDVWRFNTGAGSITLNVNPWISPANSRGGNLDVRLELYNSGGALVTFADPPGVTYASITTTVAAGTYYLHIKPVGAGTPMANPPTGYTVYGSLGQYFIAGTVAGSSGLPSVSIAASVPNASEAGPTPGKFTLTRTGATTSALPVSVSIGGMAINGSDYVSLSTNYTIPAGAASLDIPVTPIDDTTVEETETVIMTIDAGPAYIGSGSATVNVADNDSYANGPGRGITREWWTGIPGSAVADLTGNAAYPNSPTGSVLVTTLFEAPTDWAENYGTRMHGYFIPPATGAYTFYIASDDSSELWLSTNNDPANVVRIAYVSAFTTSRNWTAYATQKSAPVNLVAGNRYYIRALQKEGGGADNLAVGVDLPGGVSERPIPGHRLDPWSSMTTPAAPTNLIASAVSNSQINLTWTDNASNETGFKIERKTGAGGTWAQIATTGANVNTYSNTGLASNTTYVYRVRSTNAVGDSAYSNEAGATTGNQPPTVQLTAPANGATFTAPASIALAATAGDPDGAVTKVEFYNGATKLGEDTSSPYNFSWNNVPVGSYALVAKATDNNGATATSTAVNITVTSGGVIGSGNGLRGEYFGDNVLSTSLLVRTDPTVNFDWGDGPPAAGVPENGFSVRWTGQIQAQYSEEYTITTVSDDGVRLWIGGNLIIDNWTDHAPVENSKTLTLVAGQKYDLKMEYYENGGGAVAKLLWSSPSTAKQFVPQSQLYTTGSTGNGDGLRGEYFGDKVLSTSLLVRTDPTVNFDWGDGPPAAGVPENGFSVRWTGQIQAQYSEEYTITTVSDDGVRLWIGGSLIIDNWTDHAPVENSKTLTLVAGQKYDLKMEYYENGGGAVARLLWSSSSTVKQFVPQSQLYTAGGVTTPAAPTSLVASAVSSSQINLVWTDKANNETGFKIERKTGVSGTWAQIATTGANVTSYSNTGLASNTTYVYRVRATNAVGDSAYSNEASATTTNGILSWVEPFESYAIGSQLHGQGGWKGWDNNAGAGALTSNALMHGGTRSVAIVGASDLVHEFTGATAGSWTFSAWQYVPLTFTGAQCFILMNTYQDGGAQSWSSQVRFDGTSGRVHSDGDGAELALVRGRWVEVRVEIDLGLDVQRFWYDGQKLYEKSWTNGVSTGGLKNIAAVDLFANGASVVYYDDLSLQSAVGGMWQSVDLGEVGKAGRFARNDRAFIVSGSGADIGGTADEGHFVYLPMSGDGSITARVSNLLNADPKAKAGVMIRQSLNAASGHVSAFVTPEGTCMQRRHYSGKGAQATGCDAGHQAPSWVRVVRTGNTFKSYRSHDGLNWTMIGQVNLPWSEKVYVGLAVTSHGDGALTTARFEQVKVETATLVR